MVTSMTSDLHPADNAAAPPDDIVGALSQRDAADVKFELSRSELVCVAAEFDEEAPAGGHIEGRQER